MRLSSDDPRVVEAKRQIRARSVDGVQRRTVPLKNVEVRAKGEDGGFTIRGHAAVFDDLSENLGGFREKIDPGAFAKVLAKSPDVRALFNHDPNLVLARTTNQTLTLSEDERGLFYEVDPAPTSYAANLRVLLDRGDVDQSSFAFRVADDSYEEDPDTGGLIRTIHEFSALYDVSPVTYPAYPSADADSASQRGGKQLVPYGDETTPDGRTVYVFDDRTSPDEGERTPQADAQEHGTLAPSDDERAGDAPTVDALTGAEVRARIRSRGLAMSKP